MIDVTTDTTVIVKGLIPPRRKKKKAIEIGMRTKASGFDVVFMSCAEVTGSILITDDKGMYEKARDYGLETKFLRDLNEEL